MSTEVAATPVWAGTARLHPGGLRVVAICAGIGWALAFIVVGTFYRLQMFGDGAIFSYAVAIGEGWAIHWHNIAGRMSVYVLCLAPAEAYVRWTDDAAGGVTLYGLLFFGSQILGLASTFVLDRSASRVIFTVACASTAWLCPLVFGFPTEMWIAHAIFWPTLALCHYGWSGLSGGAALLLAMLALIFTHEGAVILAAAIVMTALLRGPATPIFLRSAAALIVVLGIWGTVKMVVTPDQYFTPIFASAQLNFFNARAFATGEFALAAAALAGYFFLFIACRHFGTMTASVCSGLVVFAGLTAYWLCFDPALHAENRYFLRTALVIATPCFGFTAVALVLAVEERLQWPALRMLRYVRRASSPLAVSAGAAALLIVTFVHVVEAARFVTAWTEYTTAVRDLATGTASDPRLGNPRFVSSGRIATALQSVSWSSTTPFLSVLLAPNFSPTRLVVDPAANYFWLPCSFALENETAERAIPAASRHMIGTYSCLHR